MAAVAAVVVGETRLLLQAEASSRPTTAVTIPQTRQFTMIRS
jgi:hypothetical protein